MKSLWFTPFFFHPPPRSPGEILTDCLLMAVMDSFGVSIRPDPPRLPHIASSVDERGKVPSERMDNDVRCACD